jgi:hypothetical protein
VGKLGQAVKAKEELDGSTDPDLAVKLDAKFQNATSEYRKIWNAMSEPDRIILSNNLKFADLRGRPTDRGVRYAKYLMKKYGQDLKRNPGLPWMRFLPKTRTLLIELGHAQAEQRGEEACKRAQKARAQGS